MKKCKHTVSIFLAVLLLLCAFVPLQVGATAPYITEGDFLYVENDDGTLSVFRYNASADTVSIPATVQNRPVTDISSNAFLFHSTLREVTLPESIHRIGMNAFGDCSNLTSINLDHVQVIESMAFLRCTNLLHISFAEQPLSIGADAFEQTAWLENQPDGVVYAGQTVYQYKGNTGAATVQLKEGTKAIAAQAFSGCSFLTEMILPDGIENIQSSAFANCRNLEKISFPATLTKIEMSAFFNCEKLTDLQFPDSLHTVGGQAFAKTAWLESQSDGLVYAGRVAYVYKGSMPQDTSLTLNPGTVSVAQSAFSGCSGLKEIVLPDSVKEIGTNAFVKCTNLSSVSIPSGVTHIESGAFTGCDSLTSVTIPLSVTSIGSAAFGYNAYEEQYEAFTIYGYPDSVAQAYAQENQVAFVPLSLSRGDLNGDNKITTSDVLTLQTFLAKSATLTTQQQQASDTDQNTILSTSDVLLMQKYIAKMIDKL